MAYISTLFSIRRISTLLTMALTFFVAAYAQDQVEFNYNGRVSVGGEPFTGIGYFKFGLVDKDGDIMQWDNEGSPQPDVEPSESIPINVNKGFFSVDIGDPELGMAGLSPTIFNQGQRVYLRVWFSDGTHGFERLQPDRRIVNPNLLGIFSGDEDMTIYVDAATGNDLNNGLTTDTAKLTIQAAIDMLPGHINCNLKIKVFSGVYREVLSIHGISVNPKYMLTLVGDESWRPTLDGSPNVRVTGAENDSAPTQGTSPCLHISDVQGMTINGIRFDYGTIGIQTDYSRLNIKNCQIKYCYDGILNSVTYSYIYDTECAHNSNCGLYISNMSRTFLTRCVARYNKRGLSVFDYSPITCYVSGDFSNNSAEGIFLHTYSRIYFHPPCPGTIHDNGTYGIYGKRFSSTQGYAENNFSGNGTAPIGSDFSCFLE